MKRLTYIMGLGLWIGLTGMSAHAQKLLTRTGHIWFESNAPLEKIEAHSHQAMSILDLENEKIAFSCLIKGFQFEKALMQEHFNEKYMESDTYPKATYSGKLAELENVDFQKEGEYVGKTQGTLTIHGVSREIEARGTFTVEKGRIGLHSEFTVDLTDFDIRIPSVVRDNISKTILIFLDVDYEATPKT